ncbi:hypothetical protein A7E78_11800 [Syntrophotalea acetylenivorans]|uniref:DUF3300 domain-containing protein n=1 Tax=Syntrophotalea acetylenivorans TaxID=1842532 RepID=A0A1L3GR84_9BACT|nr:DUF3300 domain-containing protein [Syntrophotalea acetylenivorans]APG28466.1 hypothetical protein A7E78_11800 [Syntrophotalea acetylenivorans]
MKAATLYHLALGLIIASLFVFGFTFLPTQVRAEDNGYAEASETYSREELAQMLAPIALYPDSLLSQILMASTYPIEVIEADRWRKNNRHLQGETLDDALADEYWDPSVKALCHFPDILSLMSERIGETTNLGNAFLAQEEQVMDTVQELRAAAYAQGNLTSSDRQKVVVEKETIIIQPADPRIVYVPYYDPVTIYGRWWYPAYSPWYWGPPGVSIGFGIGYWPGFYFSFSYGNWSYFNWHRRYVHIDVHKRPRYVHHTRWYTHHGRWHHTPAYRRGVAYRDNRTARKYDQAPRTLHYRRDTRGFPQRQELIRTGRSIDRTRQRMDQQRIDRQQIERTTQTRERVETNRHRGTMTPSIRQPRTRVDTNRSIRTQIERDRKQRGQMTKETRQQRRIDRSEYKKSQQVRVGRDRKASQPAVRMQRQKRIEQTAPRQQVERQPRRQPRDSAFNRIDQGVKERRSSERGRNSWQGRTGNTRENRTTRGINHSYRDRNRR